MPLIKMVPHPDCTCDRCKAGLSCSYKQSINDSFPRQHTVAGAFLKGAAEQLPHATDAEIDELIARVESLKLARLLRQRAELMDSVTEHVDVTKALHAALSEIQRGIDELIRRGVQP